MPTLSAAQLYTLARNSGLSATAATTAAAVALAESGGRSDAVGDVGLENATWGPSVGPWQIRTLKAETGTGGPRDINRLKDPAVNAASMASISRGGSNFGPWSTFTSGKYRSFLGAGGATSSTDASTPSSGGSVASSMGGLFGWQGGVFTIGLKLAAAGAAAALVIVGAVHTVSSN